MLPYVAVFIIPFAAVTLALTLYFMLLTKLKPSTEIKLSSYIKKPVEKKSPKKPRRTSKTDRPKDDTRKGEIEEKECPHYVGYLTTLPKGSPFPDECFGCRRVIQCLRIEPTRVIESFYLPPPETEQH